MTAANGAVVVAERSRAHRRLGGDIVDLCLSQTNNFDLIEAALIASSSEAALPIQCEGDGGQRDDRADPRRLRPHHVAVLAAS